MVAVKLQKLPIIKLLIATGSSQAARDKEDRNIIHLLLENEGLKPEKLREILDCFDKTTVKKMMLERCKVAPTALTPLALFLARVGRMRSGQRSISSDVDILKVIAEYSSGEELEMLNGEGDLPLHVAIKNTHTSMVEYLLTLCPNLLHRENATGRTPLEMAYDIYIQDIVSGKPGTENHIFDQSSRYHRSHISITSKSVKEFLPIEERGFASLQSNKRTYEVCLAVDWELRKSKGGLVKRRLVSLNEANEVARRLAISKGKSRKVTESSHGNEKLDEIEEWL